jgi:hypothetical protein
MLLSVVLEEVFTVKYLLTIIRHISNCRNLRAVTGHSILFRYPLSVDWHMLLRHQNRITARLLFLRRRRHITVRLLLLRHRRRITAWLLLLRCRRLITARLLESHNARRRCKYRIMRVDGELRVHIRRLGVDGVGSTLQITNGNNLDAGSELISRCLYIS